MNRALLNLLQSNRERGSGLRIVAEEGDAATVYLYDAIGPGGVEAKAFVDELNGIKAGRINLRINSPGGDVFEARAMKAALEQHRARVTTYVDGLAASAASVVMLAAERILIAPGAFVMIHNPWGMTAGDARDMRAMAGLLDQVGAAIRADYARRTSLPPATIAKMMDAETWLEASDAVAKGFANEIMRKPEKVEAQARGFDLTAYGKAPAALTSSDLDAERLRQTARLRLYQ